MTTSLEISKELWERGVRLDTRFYHEPVVFGLLVFLYEDDDFRMNMAIVGTNVWMRYKREAIGNTILPAPMLHELLEIIPDHIKSNGTTYTPALYFGDFVSTGREYWFGYEELPSKKNVIGDMNNYPNPADALGRCLIYLIDNGYCVVREGKVVVDG